MEMLRFAPTDREPALRVSERQVRDVTILNLEGRLDEDDTADQLHSLIRRLVRAGRRRFLLNMRQLEPLDTPALCSLLTDLVKVRGNGGDITLLNVQPAHMDLLLRTSTEEAFRIFDDEQNAVAALENECRCSVPKGEMNYERRLGNTEGAVGAGLR